MAALTPAQYRTFKLPDLQKQRLTAQHAKLREQQQELIMQQSRAKTPAQQAKLAQQAQRLAHMINKISQQLVQCKLAEEYEQAQGKSMSMSAPPAPSTMASASVSTLAAGLTRPTDIKVETPAVPTVGANGTAAAALVVGASVTDLTGDLSVATHVASANGLAVPGTAVALPGAVGSASATGVLPEAVTAAVPSATLDATPFKSVVPDLTGLGASEKLLTAVAAYEKHKPEVLKRGAGRFARIAVTIGAKLNTSYVAT